MQTFSHVSCTHVDGLGYFCAAACCSCSQYTYDLPFSIAEKVNAFVGTDIKIPWTSSGDLDFSTFTE